MIRDKIIIVEDDPGISKYLQAALRSHEYDTLLAPDGKTALEMIASHCPDLLLLDLGLPDMDGSEIIRSVRAWSRMPHGAAPHAHRRHERWPGHDGGVPRRRPVHRLQ